MEMYHLELVKHKILHALQYEIGVGPTIIELNTIRRKRDILLHCGQHSDCYSLTKALDQLLHESADWDIPVASACIQNNILLLQLNRKAAFFHIISNVLFSGPSYGQKKSTNQRFVVCCQPSKAAELTAYRQQLISEVAKNLLSFGGYDVSANGNDRIVFTTNNFQVGIYCGKVCQSSGSNDISVEDYISIRESDIRTIAEHKYWDGSTDSSIRTLAEASVAIDLIAIKHSSVVKLNTDRSTAAGTREKSNKGAAFLLYNCARLTAIEKKYNENFEKGYFPSLPALQNVDFSLLSEDEEWHILFNFIMEFPGLMSRTIANITTNQIGQHYLCSFLFKFCQTFSVYYRRHRILQEPKPHLLPILFARIYLAKAINNLLKQALKILNIDVLERM